MGFSVLSVSGLVICEGMTPNRETSISLKRGKNYGHVLEGFGALASDCLRRRARAAAPRHRGTLRSPVARPVCR